MRVEQESRRALAEQREKKMNITDDAETLLRQASMTADTYLAAAIRDINTRLGEGYAQKHPELVAAFIDVCAKDFGTAVLANSIQEAAGKIASALSRDQ